MGLLVKGLANLQGIQDVKEINQTFAWNATDNESFYKLYFKIVDAQNSCIESIETVSSFSLDRMTVTKSCSWKLALYWHHSCFVMGKPSSKCLFPPPFPSPPLLSSPLISPPLCSSPLLSSFPSIHMIPFHQYIWFLKLQFTFECSVLGIFLEARVTCCNHGDYFPPLWMWITVIPLWCFLSAVSWL